MEKVLVTGGCGFIGSHIVEELIEAGYEVAVVDNLTTGKLDNIRKCNVKFFYCDIADEYFEEVIRTFAPKYIIHQAAQVSVTQSIEDMTYDAKGNIICSVRIIDLSVKYNVRKIIFASSAAVYGNPQYLPIDIEHPLQPLSPYGVSKYTVEQYLLLSKKLYDINYTILRYSNVYGPRQIAEGEGGVISIFLNQILNKKKIHIYGDGEQTRDFVYVKDVARANVLALHQGDGKTVNVSSNSYISINELIDTINQLTCVECENVYKKGRRGDIRESVLCNKLARREIGWEPRVELRAGISYTWDYFKAKNECVIH